ncbi:MAG TPA: CBS domain-containing protein [Pyrinomonadaceae bacterium]|nr:CBS domain-containing protein [Pyrinomonadaceae bacterium]
MICPSCGYDNIEGDDRCVECMTPLFDVDAPRGDQATNLARSVMEDDLSQLENEFLSVTPDTAANEVVGQMRQARLGCALVLDNGKLVGIFTERDLLNKLTGHAAVPPMTPVKQLMSSNPEILLETDSVASALNKMSLGRYRHIPVKKSDGTYYVTSIKHVLKYLARSNW